MPKYKPAWRWRHLTTGKLILSDDIHELMDDLYSDMSSDDVVKKFISFVEDGIRKEWAEWDKANRKL